MFIQSKGCVLIVPFKTGHPFLTPAAMSLDWPDLNSKPPCRSHARMVVCFVFSSLAQVIGSLNEAVIVSTSSTRLHPLLKPNLRMELMEPGFVSTLRSSAC